ncbi:MAG TPA: hypothetical protein VJJ24_01780 [Candidatus Paceibacterota bacterium]
MLELFNLHVVAVIVHLIGVALGAGGAFVSDAMFFSTIKDLAITKTEIRFLKVASKVIWLGLLIIIISGIGLFLFNPDRYLHSSKFLAKLTIVLVIAVNGLIFHFVHLKYLARQIGDSPRQAQIFFSKSKFLFASGAVSVVSWVSALILGVFKSVPYSYFQILGTYLVIVLLAILSATILRRRYLLKARKMAEIVV